MAHDSTIASPKLDNKQPQAKVDQLPEFPTFPSNWGNAPDEVFADYVPLAGGYGHGSSTVSLWIMENMKVDRRAGNVQYPPAFGEPPEMQTEDWVPLPFGYGHGSSTIGGWLEGSARRVYSEEAKEYKQWYKQWRRGHSAQETRELLEPSAPEPEEPSSDPPEPLLELQPPVAEPVFPLAWGVPPQTVTEDWRPLAGGYGHGSSTISGWILHNIKRDRAAGSVRYPPMFGEPPEVQTEDWVPLPFGYGRGSSTVAGWLKDKGWRVYEEKASEYENMYLPKSAGTGTAVRNPRAVQAAQATAQASSGPSLRDLAQSIHRDLRDIIGGDKPGIYRDMVGAVAAYGQIIV